MINLSAVSAIDLIIQVLFSLLDDRTIILSWTRREKRVRET